MRKKKENKCRSCNDTGRITVPRPPGYELKKCKCGVLK